MKILGTQAFFADAVDRIVNDVRSVLVSGQLTKGEHLKKFEKRFSEIIGTKYALGVNSGGAGLELILKALNIQGKEIIVPTNTFIASASAVIQAGGRVVFADSDKNTLSLDIKKVEPLINGNTAGIMIVYMFGLMPQDINELKTLCEKHNLYLIEDTAHAHGASYRGMMAGSLGDAASFSFYATKIITTGEGGMVTTNRRDVFDRILQLRDYGKSLDSPGFELISNNYRLAEIPAILGNYQLQYLDENIRRRNQIAQYYIEELKNVAELEFLKADQDSVHSFWRFPVYLNESVSREKLQTKMAEDYDIRITWMYEPLCHLQPVFRQMYNHKQGDFPVAEQCIKKLICLPTHMRLTDDNVKDVCAALKNSIPLCQQKQF